jgi:putative toxin-antitoxin system antitoxin component (TIGR02293 family)
MQNLFKQTEALLGGPGKLPVRLHHRADYLRMTNIGLSKENFDSLRRQTGLDVKTASAVLSLTPRTIQRFGKKEKFRKPASEKLLRLADLYARGYSLFGTKEKFQEWISSPNMALENQTPISLLDNHYGLDMIESLIGRMEYGIYS